MSPRNGTNLIMTSLMSARVRVEHDNVASLQPESVFMHDQGLPHLAVQYSLPCLHLLLSLGVARVQVNQKDHLGKTPLHLAATNATEEGVRAVLAFDQSIKHVDHAGNTALHVACQLGEHTITRSPI